MIAPPESTPSTRPNALALGVCTFNRGPRILPTLEAIARMEGARLTSIVIVDNRSDDDTADIVDGFIASHPDLPMRRVYEAGPGKPAAVCRLFAEAREPIVAMIDDDCVPDRDWARAVLSVFDDHPKAGAVGGPVRNAWEAGPSRLARIYHRSLGDQLLGSSRIRLEAPGAFLMGGALAMRRSAVEHTGWLRSRVLDCRRGARMDTGDDAELCIRMRQAGYEVWYEPAAKADHLIPEWRQTSAYLARLRESICRSEPWLAWMIEARPTRAWAAARARKARLLWLKSVLFDWRPARRRVRIAERLGRARGWEQVRVRVAADDHARGRSP